MQNISFANRHRLKPFTSIPSLRRALLFCAYPLHYSATRSYSVANRFSAWPFPYASTPIFSLPLPLYQRNSMPLLCATLRYCSIPMQFFSGQCSSSASLCSTTPLHIVALLFLRSTKLCPAAPLLFASIESDSSGQRISVWTWWD